MLSYTKDGIQRFEADSFGDILSAPTGAILSSGMITSVARDSGSTPTTYLRAGLVLSKLSSGMLKEFGENLTRVTDEAVGTGNSSTKAWDLAKARIIPGSETVKVNNVTQTKDLYTIDYQMGILTFKAAPGVHAIVASYTHIKHDATYGYVTDGTEVPYAILADPISLLDAEGVAKNTSARIVLAGQIKLDSLIVGKTGALDYAKAYFSRHGFVGIVDETEF